MSTEKKGPLLSRRDFLKLSGITAAGVGLAAYGVPVTPVTPENSVFTRGVLHAADLFNTNSTIQDAVATATATPQAVAMNALDGISETPMAPSPDTLVSTELLATPTPQPLYIEPTATLTTTEAVTTTAPISSTEIVTDSIETEETPELLSLPWQDRISRIREEFLTDEEKIALAAIQTLHEAEVNNDLIQRGDNVIGHKGVVIQDGMNTRTRPDTSPDALMLNETTGVKLTAGSEVRLLGYYKQNEISGANGAVTERWAVASQNGQVVVVATNYGGSEFIKIEDPESSVPYLDDSIVTSLSTVMDSEYQHQLPSPEDTPMREIIKSLNKKAGILVNDGDNDALGDYINKHTNAIVVPLTWGHQVESIDLTNGKATVGLDYTKWVAEVGRSKGREVTINHIVFPGATQTMNGQDWFSQNGVTSASSFEPVFKSAINGMLDGMDRTLNASGGAVVSVVNEPRQASQGRANDKFGDILGDGDYSNPEKIIPGYIDTAYQTVTDNLDKKGLLGKVKRGFSETAGGMLSERTDQIIEHLKKQEWVDVLLVQAHEKLGQGQYLRQVAEYLDSKGLPWRFNEVSGAADYVAEVTKIACEAQYCEGIQIWEDKNFTGVATVMDVDTGTLTNGFYAMYNEFALSAISKPNVT